VGVSLKSIKDLTQLIVNFRDERNWEKYHTAKNLSLSLIIELGELFELFQWTLNNKEMEEIIKNRHEELSDEIADVAIYLFLLAHELNIDLEKAILSKIKKNAKKYPVE